MTSSNARRFGVLVIAALGAACGGSSAADAFNEPAGDASTSSDSSTTTSDGSPSADTTDLPPSDGVAPDDTTVPDTGPGPGVTLDNVCNRLAETTCTAAFSSCCSTKGLAYKEAGCRAAINASCSAQVKEISGGKGTFNAAAFPACASAWNNLATKCSVTVFDFIKSYAPCKQLLNGYRNPGESCDDDWQCRAPAGAYASCNREGRCEVSSVVGAGAMCVYGGLNRAYCDYGLQCAFTGGASGTCAAAKPLGTACNNHFECGFGNYCERTGSGGSSVSKCAVGRTAGAACFEGPQCASGSCVSNRCTDPTVTPANPALCSGTTG